MCLRASLNFSLRRPEGVTAVHFPVCGIEHGHFGTQSIQIKKPRFESVVEIGRVVSDFIHQVNELGF